MKLIKLNIEDFKGFNLSSAKQRCFTGGATRTRRDVGLPSDGNDFINAKDETIFADGSSADSDVING